MGIWFLGAKVGDHPDVRGGFVRRYVASLDHEHCVRSLYVHITLHQSSKFAAGCVAPSGTILALDASSEEISDPGLRASRRVHYRVGEVMGEEVGEVRVRVAGGGNR